MAQDVKCFLKVGISVGVVGTHLHFGKVFPCGFEYAGCEGICGCLAFGSINAPSVRLRPFCAVSVGVHVDADKDCILLAVEQTPAVDTPAALLEGDIVILWNEKFGIIASVLKIQNYTSCDFAVEEGFTELPFRGTFAGSELTVAIVDEDFHLVAVLVQLTDSKCKVTDYKRKI